MWKIPQQQRLIFKISLLLLVFVSGSVKGATYVYQNPKKTNFVKIEKAKKEETEGGLDHPFSFTPDQIEGVLRSIHINKKDLVLKDIKNRQLLDEKGIKLLSPYIVEAFQKAGEREVVEVSYVRKEPFIIFQNDRLTRFRAFVKNDGLHLRFLKLYAKLSIEQSPGSNIRGLRSTEEAQSMGVRLALQEGQVLFSSSPVELLLDVNALHSVSPTPPGIVSQNLKSPETSAPLEKSIRERLKTLESLKQDGTITESEYRQKREEIIKGL